jgi:UDP-N-acetyl-2-amino-2-deoxyglucuronate dehydrogenase
MDKIRYGIVGCGVIFSWHIEVLASLKEIATLTAICDSDPEALKKGVEKTGVKGYSDINQLVADSDIDAVIVCTPSGYHGDHAIAALKAGKHVMSEKPIEVSLTKADAMIAAAKESGTTLACISQNRYGSGIQQLHKWLDEGKLGKLIYGESAIKWYRTQEYYDSGAWRGTWALDGGGALMNQGVHYADQLRWAMGKPKRVVANMATLGHKRIEVEDIVSSTIEFENGAIGSLTATTCAYPGFETRIEVYGSEGSVRIVNNELEIARFSDGSEFTSGSTDIADTGSSHPTSLGTYLHYTQMKDFTEAIIGGYEPQITAEDGRAALELVLAVYEAARTGEPVTHFA